MTDEAAPISVVIADDQGLVRAGFRVILDNTPGIDVVGEAADGQAAVAMVHELAPTVVLMDIRMPILDGLQAAREIVATTASKVLMLTTFDADEYVYEALRDGASGFLLKDARPEQLVGASGRWPPATRSSTPPSPDASSRPSPACVRPLERTAGRAGGADPRELEVLRLIARGLVQRGDRRRAVRRREHGQDPRGAGAHEARLT